MAIELLKCLEHTRAMLLSSHLGEDRVPMMERRAAQLAVALFGLGLVALSIAPSAQAQGTAPGWTTDIGLSFGATALPQGDKLGGVDVVGGLNSGLTASGSVGIRPAASPFSYRVEVQYARFGLNDEGRFGAGGAPVTAQGNASILSGTGNVLLSASLTGRLRSYMIGGAGVYKLSSNVHYTAENGRVIRYLSVPTDGKTRFGLNGGAGLEVAVGPVRSFVEARFHSVFSGADGASFIPVSVGVKF